MEQASLINTIVSEREKMLIDGILKVEGKFYVLTKDYVFTSPSRAAAATLARSSSGPLEWKTREGIQLKHFEWSYTPITLQFWRKPLTVKRNPYLYSFFRNRQMI
ncbi:MAG: DUF4357 domain-containing protein [Bacteroidota bacterium]